MPTSELTQIFDSLLAWLQRPHTPWQLAVIGAALAAGVLAVRLLRPWHEAATGAGRRAGPGCGASPCPPSSSRCYSLINNVETLACVPWIVRRGEEAFAAIGTKSSKGTKVFALAGKVQRGGLIEVAMGTTIREIVDEIGGGVVPGRRFKAVQIGGPSGGCVPARLADTPVDYESLREVGAIMGSGGLVVLDETDCMVDIARYFLRFTQDQSCGKCTFCRVGTRRMLDLLEMVCVGNGRKEHLEELERLAWQETHALGNPG